MKTVVFILPLFAEAFISSRPQESAFIHNMRQTVSQPGEVACPNAHVHIELDVLLVAFLPENVAAITGALEYGRLAAQVSSTFADLHFDGCGILCLS